MGPYGPPDGAAVSICAMPDIRITASPIREVRNICLDMDGAFVVLFMDSFLFFGWG
ncbi:MAG: hypothetical protein BWY82_02942 [Verrucomicrobia bacterium ADurb.Bin474]|nr:MAG: hypothetical protein BWY82_02942 [Verrucomicrobia bacterium ADurb.Bin474]